jgi:hypothetical protein
MTPLSKHRPWIAFPALCLLLAPAPGRCQTLTQKMGPATALLTGDRVVKDVLEVRLSGAPRLILRVEGEAPLAVELPAKIVSSGAWRLRPAGPAVTTALPKGLARWEQTFDLEPLAPGKQDLQPAPLRFKENDRPWQEIAWKPFAIRVTTQIRKADIGAAHDITPIEELPARPSVPAWLLGPAAALIVGSLLLLFWRLRRRLPQVLPLPPRQAALRELDRLAALPLATGPEVARYHTLLADVIRRYLERHYRLAASRKTTVEFLDAVRRAPELTAGQQELLADLLGRCDLAKFAPVTPPLEECQAAAALARRLIEDAVPHGHVGYRTGSG